MMVPRSDRMKSTRLEIRIATLLFSRISSIAATVPEFVLTRGQAQEALLPKVER